MSGLKPSPVPVLAALAVLLCSVTPALAQTIPDAPQQTVTIRKADLDKLRGAVEEAKGKGEDAQVRGDSAWMMTSSGLVMLMVPGLALFYGGMVRRKNILATMMQSMVALAVVGVYWFAVGYALAFGDPLIKLGSGNSSLVGWSSGLVFLKDVGPKTMLPGSNIPVYLHVLFQGMFAIITPALISGAVAERIRFKPYCIFLILWITFVYCPLAHMVWAQDWNWFNTLLDEPNAQLLASSGSKAVGLLGGATGAIDFAGGTVVHIAAGFSALAAILILRRRLGYPEHSFHPNSMVLALTGAGLLWFGWFGFNGGSAVASNTNAVSAFAATQAAAAAAGLSWMVAEWLHRGKPTALGLASGIVAGLVAVTPASGFVYPWGGLVIGLVAGVVCYAAVCLKPLLKYDDSLDAFGVHGVGGFLGAVLTGVFCYAQLNPDWKPGSDVGVNGLLAGNPGQVLKQLLAALASAALAVVGSAVLVKLVDALVGFMAAEREEVEGLDRTEHGEVGFDLSLATEETLVRAAAEPRPAVVPPDGVNRFSVVVEGVPASDLIHVWSDLCQPHKEPPTPEFRAVYPFLTTVQGNRFRFRGGDPTTMRDSLQRLFQRHSKDAVRAHVD